MSCLDAQTQTSILQQIALGAAGGTALLLVAGFVFARRFKERQTKLSKKEKVKHFQNLLELAKGAVDQFGGDEVQSRMSSKTAVTCSLEFDSDSSHSSESGDGSSESEGDSIYVGPRQGRSQATSRQSIKSRRTEPLPAVLPRGVRRR